MEKKYRNLSPLQRKQQILKDLEEENRKMDQHQNEKIPVFKKNSKSINKNNAPTAKAVALNFPMSPTTKGKVPPLKF